MNELKEKCITLKYFESIEHVIEEIEVRNKETNEELKNLLQFKQILEKLEEIKKIETFLKTLEKYLNNLIGTEIESFVNAKKEASKLVKKKKTF